MTKSERIWQTGHIARMVEMKNCFGGETWSKDTTLKI